jgi:hypothetical protein
MTQRACFLLLGVVVLFLGSALRPVAAYVDRGEWGAGLPRQPLPAAVGGLISAPLSCLRRSPRAPDYGSRTRRSCALFRRMGPLYRKQGGKWKSGTAMQSQSNADWTLVSVSVEPLTPGEYTVRYRTVFSDTHLVSGAWVFEVRHQ